MHTKLFPRRMDQVSYSLSLALIRCKVLVTEFFASTGRVSWVETAGDDPRSMSEAIKSFAKADGPIVATRRNWTTVPFAPLADKVAASSYENRGPQYLLLCTASAVVFAAAVDIILRWVA